MMSTGELQSEPQAQAQTTAPAAADTSFLDQVIKATPATSKERGAELIRALVDESLKGTVTFDKNMSRTLTKGIAAIDAAMSKQLAAILHHPEFQQLEGTWRGLNYLVMNSETGTQLKIRVLNVSKRTLFKEMEKSVEFDQSQLFKKLYENEFGTPGGEPYGALIGDYEFTNHPDDIALLGKISGVCASAFCPFISAASPGLMGMETWSDLSRPRDLAKIFDTVEHAKWKSFRDSEDSRFVTLCMPRTLSRLPYGANTKPIDEFAFEELELDAAGKGKPVSHDQYTWMNASYVMGTKLTDAFAKYGWCTAVRGAEGGGKVEDLPVHIFYSDEGDIDMKCPTEVGITDRREKELSDLGFLPLVHYKNTDYAVFFGAQTTQKPKKYDTDEATANAAISARLPYMMATSRIAHYLKVMARDWIGKFMEASDCEKALNRWIMGYVLGDKNADAEMKAKFPLAEAKVKVEEVPGAPGSYNAVAWLRPWLQLEELTTSLRMVAKIPTLQK
jgi:type VI secretion system protein ImpC